ncbi:MAG: hypothetical protein HQ582_21955 [Planctomycetes bacterium]|nr:hypothetical protein [Planctomycetota bacterium]
MSTVLENASNDDLRKATLVCYVPSVWVNNLPDWIGQLWRSLNAIPSVTRGGGCQVVGPDQGEEWLKRAVAAVPADRVTVVIAVLPGGQVNAPVGKDCIKWVRQQGVASDARVVAAIGPDYQVEDGLGLLDAGADAVFPHSRLSDTHWLRSRLSDVVKRSPIQPPLKFDLPWRDTSRENGRLFVAGAASNVRDLHGIAKAVCKGKVPKKAGPVRMLQFGQWDTIFQDCQRLRGAGPVILGLPAPNAPPDTEPGSPAGPVDAEIAMGLVIVSHLAATGTPVICVTEAKGPCPGYWRLPWVVCSGHTYTCRLDLAVQLHGWLIGPREDRGER